MPIQPFATGQSKLAGIALVPLIVLLPIVTNFVNDPKLLLVLIYVISVCIGCSLGWVAGDAFVHSSGMGKIITGAFSLITTISGYFASTKISNWLGESFTDLFVTPLITGSFRGAIQWAALAFVLFTIFAFLYCLAAGTPAPAPVKHGDSGPLC